MSAFVHPTKYRHYVRKYAQGNVSFPQIDIEEMFHCRYVSLSNAKPTQAKNVYEESFAERSGSNVWVSDPAEIAYDTSELTLTLGWRQGLQGCDDVQKWSDEFFEYVTAQKLEYHDTFRPNKYWQLILIAPPSVKGERLYGNQQYKFVEFKFKNFGGKAYSESQIK